MTTTEERLAALEQIIGTKFATARDTGTLAAELKPANQLPTGQYPYILSDYQIRVDIADIWARVEALPATAPTAPTPSAGLSEASVRAIVAGEIAKIPASPGAALSGDVKDQLAAFDIHIDTRRMSIGWEIDYETQAPLQIGGRCAAEIQGRSNVNGTDGQNPGEQHINTEVIVDNDGGWRVRQYAKWWNGRVRNTTNRRTSVIALDSMGDFCGSHIEVGASQDFGQSWYIRTAGTVVDIATYKVGGFIRILKSVAGYGSTDSQQL